MAHARPCWRCGYDVSATLDAGVKRCPECGEAVSYEECPPAGGERWLPMPKDGASACLVFAPTIVTSVLVAVWFVFGWRNGAMLAWAYFLSPLWLYGVYVATQRARWGGFAWLLGIPAALTLWCVNLGVFAPMWLFIRMLYRSLA